MPVKNNLNNDPSLVRFTGAILMTIALVSGPAHRYAEARAALAEEPVAALEPAVSSM
jgi:hypothetical protein